MQPTAKNVRAALYKLRNPKHAKNFTWFFKTEPGEYGEGDIFLGIKVPVQRTVAKRFQDLPTNEAFKLLRSEIHEERLTSLIILGNQFVQAGRKNDQVRQRTIGSGLIKNRKWINNWDLVDTIAPTAIGPYLLPHEQKLHHQLARSANMWDRRIAMVSTYPFIKVGEFRDALYVANLLVRDEHDLIQKAVGWMIREIGKRDLQVLRKFLNIHAPHMPRTMLRYAIEKMSRTEQQRYLSIPRTSKKRLAKTRENR